MLHRGEEDIADYELCGNAFFVSHLSGRALAKKAFGAKKLGHSQLGSTVIFDNRFVSNGHFIIYCNNTWQYCFL
jgi:hypothetical protein